MPASVTSRALDVLGAFDTEHRRLTLTDLAKRAGLPLATAHRLIGELQKWGALDRLPGGEYVIGRRLWDLGLLAPVSSGLRQAASPFLHDLYGATLATVHLAVRDGTEVLYIDRLSGHVSVPVVSKIGSRLPLHATGVGKVLLAYAPADVVESVLSGLPRVTPYTVRNPARLLAQLERVRIDGYATTGDEMSLGASSVAVPIRGPSASGPPGVSGPPGAPGASGASGGSGASGASGAPRGSGAPGASGASDDEVVAALGIVVPDLRREKSRLISALQVAARGISRTLASGEWK